MLRGELVDCLMGQGLDAPTRKVPQKMMPHAEENPPPTDVQFKYSKPMEKPYKLSDGGGFYLEVLPTGGKSWRLKYRFGGQEKRLVFGLWPEVSLKQARERREEAKTLLAQEIDPSEKRKEDRVLEDAKAVEAANTFGVVAREWHSKQARRWSQDHADRAWSRIEKHLIPAFGGIPINKVPPKDLLTVLQGLEAEGKHETAHRLRGLADNIFAYAIAAQLTEANPAAAIAKALAPSVTVHRAAIVDEAGVGRLMRSIWGYMGSTLVRGCLQVTALTAARPGEARQLEWSELTMEGPHGPIWTIPASKTKLRRDHIIPLAPS